MCKLSKREKQVLDLLAEAVPSVVAIQLHITTHNIDVIKSNVRRKEARLEKSLREIRNYKSVLHPKKKYRGV